LLICNDENADSATAEVGRVLLVRRFYGCPPLCVLQTNLVKDPVYAIGMLPRDDSRQDSALC
jgi:hypothetical protein